MNDPPFISSPIGIIMTALIRGACCSFVLLFLSSPAPLESRKTPGRPFELTRRESLYNDLTEMSKYMPPLEQALAYGKAAGEFS